MSGGANGSEEASRIAPLDFGLSTDWATFYQLTMYLSRVGATVKVSFPT